MIGETVGPYTIISELGRGGVGIVYLAEHRHLKRKVAIKFLQSGFSARVDLLERFFTEARAASLIDHSGIVRVLDCDVHSTGNAYIVMEYLVGDTLGQHLAARGRLSVAEAAAIVLRVADALAAAHTMGIIHRDLKPDNIFLLAHPPGEVKIVDFGVAKLNLPESSPSRTMDGLVMGTPLYMSPEQARGAASLDARADVYSLGCILFELLCGRPPFVYSDADTLLAAHLGEPPPAAESFNRSLPGSLSLLLEKMLAKSPAARPRLREEVIPTLESVTTGRTTVLGNAITGTPALRPAPSRRPMVTALWLALLGAGAIGGAWWVRRTPAPTSEPTLIQSNAPTTPVAPLPAEPSSPPPAPAAMAALPKPEAVPGTAGVPAAPAASAGAPERRKKLATRASGARALRRSERLDRAAAAPAERVIDVSVATDPPGSVICLPGNPVRIGFANVPLSLKASPERTTLLIFRRGYHIEKVVLAPRETSVVRSFKLRPLADDDLQPPPPCR